MTKLNKIELGDNAKLFPTLNGNIDIANSMIDQPLQSFTPDNGIVLKNGVTNQGSSGTSLDVVRLPTGQYLCHMWVALHIPSLAKAAGLGLFNIPSNYSPSHIASDKIYLDAKGHVGALTTVVVDTAGGGHMFWTSPEYVGDANYESQDIRASLNWITN